MQETEVDIKKLKQVSMTVNLGEDPAHLEMPQGKTDAQRSC